MYGEGVWILLALYCVIGVIYWKKQGEPTLFAAMEEEEDPEVEKLREQAKILARTRGERFVYMVLAIGFVLLWPLFLYQDVQAKIRELVKK
ncbi:hypothetical protein [Desmospora activa]|uniref:Uncharacterized protein n=1 Tax=Desmospora activa DSM 45169 TaxID=1121389 RepID=A0A2T4ZCH8_9BACL|nr:hypothetical protein [Desmospora activa]PTM59600.1 hypothetical protein C8J48_2228 [Desmospora activa DSM 45169]